VEIRLAMSFPWVRGLESGKGRFIENTSPSSENARAEQAQFIVKSSLDFIQQG